MDKEKKVNSRKKKKELEDYGFSRMYFPELSKYTRSMGKATLLVILGFMLINMMRFELPWWAKTFFALGALLLFAFIYYDMKYMMGVKKNPFKVFPDKHILRYYNEFEGNKDVEIDKITEVKVYTRVRPKETYLLEVFVDEQKDVENINVSGFTDETISELLEDLQSINPKYKLSTNRESKLSKPEKKPKKKKKD